MPLQDLLRAISEDRGVTSTLPNYDPKVGDELVADDRKTWREIRELLRSLRARFSEHLIVVLDNFSPHKKTELGAWVADHDIELVFTPTYSSWLNLIECQFQALRSFVLNGSDYPSHAEQDAGSAVDLRGAESSCHATSMRWWRRLNTVACNN